MPMWLFISTQTFAQGLTSAPSPSEIVRGDVRAGFELLVDGVWLSLPTGRRVDRVEVASIGDRWLVTEKAYSGGNGMGCEWHELRLVKRRGTNLIRTADVLPLGIGCWSKDGGPRAKVSPFLAVDVTGARVELSVAPAGPGRPLGDFLGEPPRALVGTWTFDAGFVQPERGRARPARPDEVEVTSDDFEQRLVSRSTEPVEVPLSGAGALGFRWVLAPGETLVVPKVGGPY